MEADRDLERIARVRRRFNMGRLDVMRRGFWEHSRAGDSAFLVAMYSFLLLLILEPVLWNARWQADVIEILVPDGVALALLLWLPVNALVVDRFLARKTPGERSLPLRLRVFRLVASVPPLYNLYTISLWKGILERRGFQAGASGPALRLALAAAGRPSPSGALARVVLRSGFLYFTVALSAVPLAAWAAWLAGATKLGGWHRALVLASCVLLHLLVAVSWILHHRLEIERSPVYGWRRTALRVSPFLWLLGLPGCLAGLALGGWAKPSTRSLTWSVFASRTGARREPLFRGSQEGLGSRWRGRPWFQQWRRPAGLTLAPAPSREEIERLSFYRLKSLFLGAESLGLASVVISRAPGLIRPVLWTAGVLAGIGLALQLVVQAARLLRASRLVSAAGRHPYGRYLFLTQAVLLGGTYLGAVSHTATVQQLGLLLAYLFALVAILIVLATFLSWQLTSRGADMTLWGALALALTALGAFVCLEGDDLRPALDTSLLLMAACSPLWSVGLFLIKGGWLLRPFRWSQVFDRRLDPSRRWTLALVALTAALPLGGLAIPFWIYAEHRIGPAFERLS